LEERAVTESMDEIIAAAITAPEWQPRRSYKAAPLEVGKRETA